MPIKHFDLNLYESSDQVNHIESEGYLIDGLTGGIDFNDDNKEDCNRIDDLEVEAAKGISSLIPHCNQPR